MLLDKAFGGECGEKVRSAEFEVDHSYFCIRSIFFGGVEYKRRAKKAMKILANLFSTTACSLLSKSVDSCSRAAAE